LEEVDETPNGARSNDRQPRDRGFPLERVVRPEARDQRRNFPLRRRLDWHAQIKTQTAGCPKATGRLKVEEEKTVALLHLDDERRASIETARLFSSVVVLRPLLAVTPRFEPASSDTTRKQILADGVRPALAEREVVFGRSDAARVTFDDQLL